MKEKKKNMSIDDLASMVKRGFDDVGERFDDANNRMVTKEDLKSLDDKLTGQMNDMEERLTRRIDGVEIRVASHASSWDKEYVRLHDWVSDLDQRINKLEDKSVKK